MKAHECYHCKQWVAEGEHHDCWTTTEAALTEELSEDLQDAYARVREAAVEFGEQRIYASGSCIMFSRTSCYFFVRPKRQYLELAVFLGRAISSPRIKRAEQKSRVKVAHIIQVRHRDEVETPLIDWLGEAYHLQDAAAAKPAIAKKLVTAKKPPAAKKASSRTPPPRAAPTRRSAAARRRG